MGNMRLTEGVLLNVNTAGGEDNVSDEDHQDECITLYTGDYLVFLIALYLSGRFGEEVPKPTLNKCVIHVQGSSSNVSKGIKALITKGLLVEGETDGAVVYRLADGISESSVVCRTRYRFSKCYTLDEIDKILDGVDLTSQLRRHSVVNTGVGGTRIHNGDGVLYDDDGRLIRIELASSAILFWYMVWLAAGQRCNVPVYAHDLIRFWRKLSDSRTYSHSTTTHTRTYGLCDIKSSGKSTRWIALRSPLELVHAMFGGRTMYCMTLEEAATKLGIKLTGRAAVIVDGEVAGNGDKVIGFTGREMAFWRLLWIMSGERTGEPVSRDEVRRRWKIVEARLKLDSLEGLLVTLTDNDCILLDEETVMVSCSPESDDIQFVVTGDGVAPTLEEVKAAMTEPEKPDAPPAPSTLVTIVEPTGVDMSGIEFDTMRADAQTLVNALVMFVTNNHARMTSAQLGEVAGASRGLIKDLEGEVERIRVLAGETDRIQEIRARHAEIHDEEQASAKAFGKLVK